MREDDVFITELYDSVKRTDLLGSLILGVAIAITLAGIIFLVRVL